MTRKSPRKRLQAPSRAPSLAELDPEGTAGLELFKAEGLSWDQIVEVVRARVNGRKDALSKRERAELLELERDVSTRSGDEPGDEAVIRAYLDQQVRFGLTFDRRGADSERRVGQPEKLAVRASLGLLATSNPRVLAEAMGIAPATLYAYSDESRSQRPGPERLYRAAHYFRFLAFEAQRAAAHLTHVASSSEPVRRGRRPNPPKKENG